MKTKVKKTAKKKPALVPFFIRVERRHKKMLKEIAKQRKIPAAEVIRAAIEEMNDRYAKSI